MSTSLASELARLERRIRDLEAGRTTFQRVSVDGGFLPVYDDDGNLRQQIGRQDDGSYTVIDVNAPPPPQPGPPAASGWPGSAVVSWGGELAVGTTWPNDFARVEVHASTTPGFIPTDATHISQFTSPRGGAVTLALAPVEHFFRLVAVNTSGAESVPSGEVSCIPLPSSSASSDGLVPPVVDAPVLVGLPRMLLAKWPGVVNPDPVTYEVHLSTVSGFTPTGATMIAETAATMITVASLPDGAALAYDTPYYVRVVAKDQDGAAAPGEETEGMLDPAGTADIAVGAITAALLESVLVLSSTIKTADSGRRVELSNTGLTLFDQAENALVSLPTDDNLPAFIKGAAELAQLTVLGNMAIRGSTNELSKGSVLTLAGKVTSPRTAPTVSIGWPSTQTWLNDQFTYERVGLTFNGDGLYGTANRYFGGQLQLFDEAGAFYGSVTIPDPAGWSNFDPSGGVTFVGGYWYFLGTGLRSTDNKVYWQFRRCTLTAGLLTLNGHSGTTLGLYLTPNDEAQWPALGNDGTNLLTAAYTSGNELRVKTYNASDWSLISNRNLGASPSGTRRRVAYVGRGNFDFGTSRVLVAHRTWATAAERYVWAYDSATDARVPSHDFVKAGGEHVGMVWNPVGETTFRGLHTNGLLRFYSANHWSTESSQWWASFTWYDGDLTGGPHETGESPRATWTMPKRATVTWSVPPIPDLGGPDDPDRARFYVGRGSTTPAMTLAAEPAAGVTQVTMGAVPFTGAAPPAQPGNFPDAGYAEVRDAAGNLLFDGSGLSVWAPVGAISMYAGATPPTGWVYCDGTERPRTDRLFGVIGVAYGTGDGSTTYNLPDLRARFPVGAHSTYMPLGSNEGSTSVAERKTRMDHAHTHSIPGQTPEAAAWNTPNTGTGEVPKMVDYDGHNHGGATGSKALGNSTSLTEHAHLGVNFIIRL